jgi:hypothetical protein
MILTKNVFGGVRGTGTEMRHAPLSNSRPCLYPAKKGIFRVNHHVERILGSEFFFLTCHQVPLLLDTMHLTSLERFSIPQTLCENMTSKIIISSPSLEAV